jgi:hypothetical protein
LGKPLHQVNRNVSSQKDMSKISDKLIRVLRDKKTVVTKAFFWKIPHDSGRIDIRLKVGRYKKPRDPFDPEVVQSLDPKSEITFDEEEFDALITFLQENYEPFKQGFKAFIPVDRPFTPENAEQVKKLFSVPNRASLIEFMSSQDIIPEDLSLALENARRTKAINEYEKMLKKDLVENDWQKWFEDNTWVLGSEFVRVLDERHIDVQNISDFLMQAYDGFLDVVEIKRPEGGLLFWASIRDHGNLVPSSDLTKAITQAARYIYEVEREANSVKFLNRVGGVRTVKPRGILIFGRSSDWGDDENEAYRILNSSYHNLTIMTYDHVLERAKRMVGYDC